MRSKLRPGKWAFAVGFFLLGFVLSPLAAPVWKEAVMALTQDTYGDLVFKCDNAMRDHMIAKQRVALRPTGEHADQLESAEIALLDCQDYDILRKRLIQFGLDENELSLMGLRAIEAKADNLHKVIEIHEIRY